MGLRHERGYLFWMLASREGSLILFNDPERLDVYEGIAPNLRNTILTTGTDPAADDLDGLFERIRTMAMAHH